MRATTRATGSATGHQRTSTKARVCWAQATGENHDSADPWSSATSPAARTTNAATSTTSASPVAARALVVTCAVTSATAPKARPAAADPVIIAAASAAGKPSSALSAAVPRRPTRSRATVSVAIAAVAGAWRPTGCAVTSSSRPVSSSARVCRTTCRMPRSASAMTSHSVSSFAVAAAGV